MSGFGRTPRLRLDVGLSEVRNPYAIRAFKNVGLWILVEFAVGTGGLFLLVIAYLFIARANRLDSDFIPGPIFTINIAVGTVALLVLWRTFLRRAHGATLSGLGYSFSRASILAGSLAAVVILIVGEFGIYRIDEALFGPEPTLQEGLRDAGLGVAVLFLVSNGFLAPIVEEYVWRGMVQRDFRVACGPLNAVVVTAPLFTAKHIVNDLPLSAPRS